MIKHRRIASVLVTVLLWVKPSLLNQRLPRSKLPGLDHALKAEADRSRGLAGGTTLLQPTLPLATGAGPPPRRPSGTTGRTPPMKGEKERHKDILLERFLLEQVSRIRLAVASSPGKTGSPWRSSEGRRPRRRPTAGHLIPVRAAGLAGRGGGCISSSPSGG